MNNISIKRLTGIFFILLSLLWTAFYVSLAAENASFENTGFEETAMIVYRVLIFPVNEIFFTNEVDNNPVAVLIGYSLNVLLFALLIEIILSQIFTKKKSDYQ
jgi:hypothetical protein